MEGQNIDRVFPIFSKIGFTPIQFNAKILLSNFIKVNYKEEK
jgi:hypothetical protein